MGGCCLFLFVWCSVVQCADLLLSRSFVLDEVPKCRKRVVGSICCSCECLGPGRPQDEHAVVRSLKDRQSIMPFD